MSMKLTNMLASLYTYEAVRNIDEVSYKAGQDIAIMDYKNRTGNELTPEEEAFFTSIEKPLNLGLINMMLYTSIVGIYENYKLKDKVMPKLSDVFKNHMYVKSEKSFANIDLNYLFRRMRNSISHYKYEYNGTHFIFKDDDNGNKEFEVKFTLEELNELLDKTTRYIIDNCDLKPSR